MYMELDPTETAGAGSRAGRELVFFREVLEDLSTANREDGTEPGPREPALNVF
jgi:hypothetical protein